MARVVLGVVVGAVFGILIFGVVCLSVFDPRSDAALSLIVSFWGGAITGGMIGLSSRLVGRVDERPKDGPAYRN